METPQAEKSLEEIMRTSQDSVFNNAAQIWNHTFYWNSLRPGGGGEPSGDVLDVINRDFGSIATFKERFIDAAKSQFGSGWAWLIFSNGKLGIETTSNAQNPLSENRKPLLTLDVWEHAYYLDYQNERKKYIESFLSHLINWDFVSANLHKRS